MRDVTKHGRSSFCEPQYGGDSALTGKAAYLIQGQVVEEGPTHRVVSRYLAEHSGDGGVWTAQKLSGHPLQVLEARMLDLEENPQDEFEADAGFVVEFKFFVREMVRNVLVEFLSFRRMGCTR
jgi:hypothetical protein